MSSKSFLQECQAKVSSKSVLQEPCALVSSKGVLQECHLSESSQGVPQVGSLESVTNKSCLCSSTFVSAFGFVGFILFFFSLCFLGYKFSSQISHKDAPQLDLPSQRPSRKHPVMEFHLRFEPKTCSFKGIMPQRNPVVSYDSMCVANLLTPAQT